MNEIVSSQPIALPASTTPMSVRVGTRDDIAFMDRLQKMHSKALGFFSRKMFEGYIDAGHVLIAEATVESEESRVESSEQTLSSSDANSRLSTSNSRLGYVISRDRYLKRDELGAVFQLCVAPGHERGFIGANLLREVFERSSYGCRLYCCWCAQDLPANKFWEAMGFVPIAYRAGGKGRVVKVDKVGESLSREAKTTQRLHHSPTQRARIHIYWQKRIRAGDTSTPYWFPAKTEGGAIREDRIILPIPPGMRWTDELPVLSGVEGPVLLNGAEGDRSRSQSLLALGASNGAAGDSHPSTDAHPTPRATSGQSRTASGQSRAAGAREKRNLKVTLNRANRFATESGMIVSSDTSDTSSDKIIPTKCVVEAKRDLAAKDHRAPAKQNRSEAAKKVSNELIQKARELRDRYLEAANAQPQWLAGGKYDVTRTITAARIEPLLLEPSRRAA